ncbi:hypothetical protein [Nonomuraea sp. SYSU D8015]|uniref:hypothetical protein n=1 Tax=Nonomuraea sp. SYSU D8015 TaxID=2593644 RepID=UPI001661325B|nr:hypothetical protein [Nonomuraea sp. SYSU D8015]
MTVAGVIVLLVNDHLLKQVWPGFVTGKLSDVAGLVVAPALLALLLWRRADLAATILTGVLFALVKTTETGAEVASHVWTLVAGPSRVLADPTDLLALPALGLAWWVRHRTLTSASSARWRIIVAMPLAVLAVTATAAAPPPPSAASVEVKDGRITVYDDVTGTWWVSDDRAATWSERTGAASADMIDDTPPAGRTDACVPYQATRCYRLVPGEMAVQQSDDGGKTWSLSWSASADDRERLVRRYGDDASLSSQSLAVLGWRGGHVVVVANGPDGILVRDEAGTWRRVGWPGQGETREVDLGPEIIMAFFLAGCMLFGAAGAGLREYSRTYLGVATATCLSFAGAAYSNAPIGSGEYMPFFDTMGFLLRLNGVIVVPTGFVVCLVLLCVGRARPVPVAVGVLGAPLAGLAVYLPFRGWAEGTPGPYWVAVALAALLTGLVLLAGIALIRGDARRADGATRPD